MTKLSEMQKRFADEYVRVGNVSQAAINAGYSEKSAGQTGARLIKNENIKAYVSKRLDDLKNQSIAEQDEVLTFLTSVMRGQETEQTPIILKDYFEIIDKEPSIKDRVKAAEQLGKRWALWTEKHEVEHSGAVQFVDDIGGEARASTSDAPEAE